MILKNKTFGEKTWNLLREIIDQGYAFLGNGRSTKIYILRKHFPSIQMVRVKGKSIAFLPDKKEEAMRALLGRMNKKVWTYQELRRVTKLFNTDLGRDEKHRMVGKSKADGK